MAQDPVSIDVAAVRIRLLGERERVSAEVVHFQADLGRSMEDATDEDGNDSHLADSASETLDREIEQSLEDNAEHLLAAIDAVQRVQDGTYGRCGRCGGTVNVERLEALPYAAKCIECKRSGGEGLIRAGVGAPSPPRRAGLAAVGRVCSRSRPRRSSPIRSPSALVQQQPRARPGAPACSPCLSISRASATPASRSASCPAGSAWSSTLLTADRRRLDARPLRPHRRSPHVLFPVALGLLVGGSRLEPDRPRCPRARHRLHPLLSHWPTFNLGRHASSWSASCSCSIGLSRPRIATRRRSPAASP